MHEWIRAESEGKFDAVPLSNDLKDARKTRVGVEMAPEDFLDSLPADDETADRAVAFREAVSKARHCRETAATLEAVYRLAGSGRCGTSLHDFNMLVYSLELNSELARTVQESVRGMFEKMSWRDGKRYWKWFRKKHLRTPPGK